jgi:hypothetical protein
MPKETVIRDIGELFFLEHGMTSKSRVVRGYSSIAALTVGELFFFDIIGVFGLIDRTAPSFRA